MLRVMGKTPPSNSDLGHGASGKAGAGSPAWPSGSGLGARAGAVGCCMGWLCLGRERRKGPASLQLAGERVPLTSDWETGVARVREESYLEAALFVGRRAEQVKKGELLLPVSRNGGAARQRRDASPHTITK